MTPFRTEAVVHHSLLLSQVRPPSTSPSAFEPERPRDTLYEPRLLLSSLPLIARRSQSMQRTRTNTPLPTAQISSFNAPDLNPGAPLTRCTPLR